MENTIQKMLWEKYGNRYVRVTEETWHSLRPKWHDDTSCAFIMVSVPDDLPGAKSAVKFLYLVESSAFHIFASMGSPDGYDKMLAVIPNKLDVERSS